MPTKAQISANPLWGDVTTAEEAQAILVGMGYKPDPQRTLIGTRTNSLSSLNEPRTQTKSISTTDDLDEMDVGENQDWTLAGEKRKHGKTHRDSAPKHPQEKQNKTLVTTLGIQNTISFQNRFTPLQSEHAQHAIANTDSSSQPGPSGNPNLLQPCSRTSRKAKYRVVVPDDTQYTSLITNLRKIDSSAFTITSNQNPPHHFGYHYRGL